MVWRTLGATAVASLMLVGAAEASQVAIDPATGGTTFTAGPGENNELEIKYTTIDDDGTTATPEVDVIEFTDYGSTMTITDTTRCRTANSGIVVYCRYTPGQLPQSTISLGDGNDEMRQSTTGRPETVSGGPGDDILMGGAGADVIDGGPGNDVINENHGCVGTYDNGIGADAITGGEGVDTLRFNCRPDAVSVTLNGAADDGASGEGDNVAGDIEIFEGGSGVMRFVGNDLPQLVKGAAEGNEISGGGGNDEIYGGVDNDLLEGGAGNDIVEGYGGSDTVDGGSGEDDLSGEGGSTITDGTGGSDTILARDGFRDTVSCGTRADQAQVDQLDIVAESSGSDTCEVVDRQNAQPDPEPGGSSLGLKGKSAKVANNAFKLVVTCNGGEECFGGASVKTASKPRREVGGAIVSIAAGQTRTIKVAVKKPIRKLLKKQGSVKVVVTLALTTTGGSKTTSKTITLRG